jgi:hypothetical protein
MKPEPRPVPAKPRTLTRNLLCLPLLILLTAMISSGCRQEAKVGPDSDFTGTYTLVSIDGHKLPFTPPHEGGAPNVTSGTFTIHADGTCGSKVSFKLPSGVESSVEVSATYTRAGSKLSMQWKGAGSTIGTIEGSTFTMNNEGMVFAYRK